MRSSLLCNTLEFFEFFFTKNTQVPCTIAVHILTHSILSLVCSCNEYPPTISIPKSVRYSSTSTSSKQTFNSQLLSCQKVVRMLARKACKTCEKKAMIEGQLHDRNSYEHYKWTTNGAALQNFSKQITCEIWALSYRGASFCNRKVSHSWNRLHIVLHCTEQDE